MRTEYEHENQRSYGLLIVGIILVLIGLILAATQPQPVGAAPLAAGAAVRVVVAESILLNIPLCKVTLITGATLPVSPRGTRCPEAGPATLTHTYLAQDVRYRRVGVR